MLINGRQAILGEKVFPGDSVTLNGQSINRLPPDKVIFILLNKPVGVVCTAARTDKRNVVDFVNHTSRIYPVGRLDKNSEGLLFLTNRCDLVDKILRADNRHEKEYVVTVNKEITDDFMVGMSGGVPMLGVVTRRCETVKESRFVFRITLTQGLNRQIRRMCRHHGYRVERLERVRIMHLTSAELIPGQYRELTDNELLNLYQELA